MGNRRAEADVQETLAYTYLSSLLPARPASRTRCAPPRRRWRSGRRCATTRPAHCSRSPRPCTSRAGRRRRGVRQRDGRAAAESGTRDRWAAALTTLAMILLDLRRPEEALTLAAAGQGRAPRLRHPARPGLRLAAPRPIACTASGTVAQARTHLREAVRILEEVGDVAELKRRPPNSAKCYRFRDLRSQISSRLPPVSWCPSYSNGGEPDAQKPAAS